MSIVSSGITLNTAYNVTGDLTGNLIFQSNGTTEAVRIDTNQNVGIGTANPSQKLEVNGWVRTGYGASALGGLELPFYSGSASSRTWRLRTDVSAYGDFSIAQATTQGGATFDNKIYIDASGNIGIGTSSPSSYGKFAIRGGITTTINGTSFSGISFEASDATNSSFYINHTSGFSNLMGDNGLAFYTGNPTVPTERVRVTTNGDVLINTTTRSNDEKFTIYQNAAAMGISVRSLGSALGNYETSDQNRVNYWTFGRDNATTGNFVFASNGSQKVAIDTNGTLLVNATTTTGLQTATAGGLATDGKNYLWITRSGGGGSTVDIGRTSSAGTGNYVEWWYNGTNTGTVSTNGSTTSYGTSSDYRLKENIVPMTGALDTVAQLKPCTYKWKADGSDGQGFIAHELQEVVPDCVTGEKDEVDADGNPKYQGIDVSFLVATLTSAIQELKTIVDAQAAEITALKAKVM